MVSFAYVRHTNIQWNIRYLFGMINSDMELGKFLLKEIIKKTEERDYHVLIGGIDASNTVSILLHEKEGFEFCGLIKQAGYKFGKWLDLAFYQLILKTPEDPNEN